MVEIASYVLVFAVYYWSSQNALKDFLLVSP